MRYCFAKALAWTLAVWTTGCWSAKVEIASLNGGDTVLGTLDSTEPHSTAGGTSIDTTGTESGTSSGSATDTNPCDWQVEQYGTVHTVTGFGSDAIYIGGLKPNGNLLLSYFDGTMWTDMASSLGIDWPELVIYDIHGSSRTDVLAVGGVTNWFAGIIRWTGTSWNPETAAALPLLAVWSNAPEDAFAAAPSALLHNDGSGWTAMDTDLFFTLRIVALWGNESCDMWGVGASTIGSVVHYDCTKWKAVTIAEPDPLPELTDIWGSAANDVYIVGNDATILRYTGIWATEALPQGFSDVQLTAVFGRSAQEVYAGGVDTQGQGIVFIRRAGAWQVFDDGLPGAPSQIWTDADGPLFVASGQGLLSCR